MDIVDNNIIEFFFVYKTSHKTFCFCIEFLLYCSGFVVVVYCECCLYWSDPADFLLFADMFHHLHPDSV